MLSGNKKYGLLGFLAGVLFAVAGLVAGLVGLAGNDPAVAGHLARFLLAHYYIDKHFVNDVAEDKLINGAIDGMVKSLDERYSRYLGTKQYEELKRSTEAAFGGIGIVMGLKNDQVMVLGVMPDTPGEAAGLLTGDRIMAVDGVPVSKYQFDEVALHVRGEVGTAVVLRIAREGEPEKDYSIERAVIRVKTAAGKLLDDNIGYIRIASFAENTDAEFKKEFERLEKEGMKALIIDVRENPGGLVTSCVGIANTVVPKGPVVSVVHRDGREERYESNLEAVKYPVAVLINGNSASASEILAGALQDTKTGILVGTKSYGKGSVQAVLPLGTGDAMKLTIAKYYTPGKKVIDGNGIEPDVKVEMPEDATEDVQLLKAEEILREKITK